ncbi:8901_t:CDS:2 [Ambispora gerdemannii]|uniref:8901_t:CDS:1 n=1 Tax=Ambispora gerdemannii TaxID=144530 RepID=A0A9N9BFJ4_9GLOM|nr:8901_t:CDS:2 [Ambispora gerdemannii]
MSTSILGFRPSSQDSSVGFCEQCQDPRNPLALFKDSLIGHPHQAFRNVVPCKLSTTSTSFYHPFRPFVYFVRSNRQTCQAS